MFDLLGVCSYDRDAPQLILIFVFRSGCILWKKGESVTDCRSWIDRLQGNPPDSQGDSTVSERIPCLRVKADLTKLAPRNSRLSSVLIQSWTPVLHS